MTAKTPEGRIVDALFRDLNDRRFLKWIFDESRDEGVKICECGSCYGLDREVRNEIRLAWRAIIREELTDA